VATGNSAERKHRLWLFTPATGGRELPSASLCGRKPCTHFAESQRRRISLNRKPNRTKSVPLTFYVTEADSRRIHQKAEACGVSLTQYLTDCAVGKEIVRIEALTEFTKALKAQGNNLNQLTTLANMGRITAVNVQETCDLYADIQRSLKTLLERTV